MTSGGQRIVGPGGQVLMARPQVQQGMPGQVLGQMPGQMQGQQIVRTSTGQILIQGGMAQQRGQVVQQQGQTAGGQQAVIRQQLPQVPPNQAGIQRVVINQPGVRPGQPGSQITVPLTTLQGLQPGQGIPTGQPGHLLVKTETGQYQILRVGPSGQGGQTTTATPVSVPQNLTGQPLPSPVRPQLAQSSPTTRPQSQPAPQPRLPTAPVARQPVAAPPPANSANSMGQQMTPDTAKIKCKNFLATLLRLASDQPESVARNVRALIQGLIDGRVEPEVFTTKLQKELNSSPQPCLVPFLKKSLPYLQHSLATRELTIEGVNPPTINQVGKLPPAMTLSAPSPQTSRPPSSLPPMSAPPHSVMGQVRQNLPTQPQPRLGSSQPQVRPTFARPGFPSLPTQPLRPGAGQYSGGLNQGQHPLLPPPKVPQAVIRDKKSGNAYSAAGDDDINDVAAMGGVNLAEEANRILGSTDNVGSVIRSCKDETFLQTGLLHQKITRICREKGLDAPTAEVISLMSHATQDRLKTLVAKLSVIAEHRLDIIKTEGPYEVTQDIKGQLRFLEDLDKMEKKRHEEAEREMLLRAAKSRTKTDDPEKEKLKAKAKEIQRDEAERIRHQEANRTALEAIGGPKKRKFGEIDPKMGPSNVPLRARTKRVHLRDVMFLMEQEKDLKHSNLLFKSYCN